MQIFVISGNLQTESPQYRLHPMFQGAKHKEPSSEPLAPLQTEMLRPGAQALPMVLGISAEHTFPFAMVPDIISLAQKL